MVTYISAGRGVFPESRQPHQLCCGQEEGFQGEARKKERGLLVHVSSCSSYTCIEGGCLRSSADAEGQRSSPRR